jgi:hypothetical protein
MKKYYAIIASLILLVATLSQAQSVIHDGNVWLQPTSLGANTWDQVTVVCDETTGACDGVLGGVLVSQVIRGQAWIMLTTCSIHAAYLYAPR